MREDSRPVREAREPVVRALTGLSLLPVLAAGLNRLSAPGMAVVELWTSVNMDTQISPMAENASQPSMSIAVDAVE